MLKLKAFDSIRGVISQSVGCLLMAGMTLQSLEVSAESIPGYDLGKPQVKTAPITVKELELLKKTVLFSEEDAKYLKKSKKILKPHLSELLDVWYGFVGKNPHLLQYFSHKQQPDTQYLEAVRKRFSQWVLDTADAKFDQAWLDYQFEIGRRHHRSGKNKTDHAKAIEHIHFRYVPALLYPVTATLKPFLAKDGHKPEEVELMHQAWIKSVLIQTILWSYPYVKDGDF